VQITLSDGRVLSGRTLGTVHSLDAGLVVIDDADDLPYAPLGSSSELTAGSWTVATGHPGGLEEGRPPVVRVGRINVSRDELLQSDNALVGGDSGGPLFDLDGRVVGIHSRIGDSMAANVHVPVDRFVERWTELAGARNVRGNALPIWMRAQLADDGIRLDLGGQIDTGTPVPGRTERGTGGDAREGATVFGVAPQSPAAEAGIGAGDVIVGFEGEPVPNEADMLRRRTQMLPGQPLTYTVRSPDGEERDVQITPRGASFGAADTSGPPSYRGVLGIRPGGASMKPGATIGEVERDSPAFRAGLRQGYRVLSVNGYAVTEFGTIARLLAGGRAGDRVQMTVVSPDDEQRDLQIVLAAYADVYPARD
jgi:S1-C subfamily serine protease